MGMYACTTAGGTAVGEPDTCKVPTGNSSVPTPFTNTGELSSATSTSETVLVSSMPVILESSTISSSSGDEEGTELGVASGNIMGSVSFKQASETVTAGGQGVVYQTCTTGQNGSSANAVGSVVSPSQETVTVSS